MIQDILQTVDVQEIVVIFHQYPKKELFFSNLKFSPTVKNSNTGGVTPKFKYFLFLYFCNSFRIRHRSLLRDFISCLPSNTSPHFGNKLFRFSEKTNFSSSVFFFLQHFSNYQFFNFRKNFIIKFWRRWWRR